MKRLLFIGFILLTFCSFGQMSQARKLLMGQSNIDMEFSVFRTTPADPDGFDLVSSDNSVYINTGIKYYSTYGTTVDPTTDATETKTFASYPSLVSIFSRFMASAPYRSVWANVANIPSSSEIINVYKTVYFDAAQTVHVGIIGDNYFRLDVNGVMKFQSEVLSASANFTYFNIFPVSVSAGNNVFSLYGKGDGTVSQTLGFVILDNTKSEVFDSPVTKDNWNILFSSEEAISLTTYNCPDGYTYDSETGECFKLLDIEDWVLGDMIMASFLVPLSDQPGVTAWTVNWGDGTSDSGTSYQNFEVHEYASGGNKTIYYQVTINGKTMKTTKTITL